MRGIALVAAGAMLFVPSGCGLLLDFEGDDRPEDASLSRDAAVADAGVRADTGVRADAGVRRDAAVPPDAGECADGGCPRCTEIEVRLTETASEERNPTIARAAGGFAVAWERPGDGTATVVRWIGADGTTTTVEWTVGATARTPSLGSADGAVALAVGRGEMGELWAYDASGVAVTAGSFSEPGGSATDPAVTADGEGWAIAWRDAIAGDLVGHVAFQRFDSTSLPRGAAVALSGGEFEADEPSIAHIGGQYLVVWDENERAALGEPNGRWASFRAGDTPAGGALGVRSDDASAAAGAESFAAVWIEKPADSALALQLFGASGGLPRGTPSRLTATDAYRDEPAVAWNGESWGVVFEEGSAAATDEVIRFVAVSPDGSAVLDARQVSHGSAFARKADLAWGGEGWGVVWEDTRDGSSEIYFAHVCP